VPIKTRGIGKVMSAGVVLLAAGTKGERSIGKNCRVMLHSVIGGHVGPMHQLDNEMEEIRNIQDQYIAVLAEETKMTKRYLRNLMKKKVNVYLSAQKQLNLASQTKSFSYLVFVKTLTMAITNFNASAAGFNFEAFLATLMAGSQIPAQGAKTIADFTADIDGSVVPISLKLYTEGQLEVGGSFTDLVNDLAVPNESWASWAASPEYDGGAMKYIVCTKDFEKSDDPLARSGVINFYEFDVSRKNVFSLLANASKAGREMISSSESFMVALKEWDKNKHLTHPSPISGYIIDNKER
jgi:hypothetical protein